MNNPGLESIPMKLKSSVINSLKISLLACGIVTSVAVGFSLQAASETKKEATAPDVTIPQASKEIFSSEDPVSDKNKALAFASKAKEKASVGTDSKNSNRAILTVGNDNFPLPIPIVKQKGKWIFDMKTGREEILNRRIGANELDAIAICRGFVEAQQEYALEKHDD